MSAEPEAKKSKVEPLASDIIGWHNLYWSEGQEKVCFRPGGNFYCDKHPAAATWRIFDGEILIDWKQCGRYVLSVDEGKHLKGFALPYDEADPKNWRKTLYHGALSPLEKMLFGDGEGTEWNLKGPEGSFPVEFRCDGHNHFVCPTLPGDSHWSLDKKGKTIIIDLGDNGKYELDVDVKSKTMDGYLIPKGKDDPDEDKDWRKAEFVKNLSNAAAVADGGGGHEGHGHTHGDGHGHTHGEGHGSHDFGGGIVGLGNLTIGSEKFMVDREGQVNKGFETEFGVEKVGGSMAGGFTAWVEDSHGQPVSDPIEGNVHDGHLHFMVTPKKDADAFVVKCGDEVTKISIHNGAAPTNDGIMAVLEDADGKHVGFIELKLHDDAGDLELWLCKDGAMSQPFDLPADTSITVTFPTHDNRSVQLAVRNMEENEDEDGKPNMRDGKTNYFVFPGESEQDPEFLIGETFRSTTIITFTADSKTYTAPPFILVPHQH